MLIILDTDVVVAAALSPTEASRYLLREVGLGMLPAAASVPLMLEYEALLKEPETLARTGAGAADVDVVIDTLASTVRPVPLSVLWHPLLRDHDDDMVLEAAANAGATHLVTFNLRDFGDLPARFGVEACLPCELARRLRDGQE